MGDAAELDEVRRQDERCDQGDARDPGGEACDPVGEPHEGRRGHEEQEGPQCGDPDGCDRHPEEPAGAVPVAQIRRPLRQVTGHLVPLDGLDQHGARAEVGTLEDGLHEAGVGGFPEPDRHGDALGCLIGPVAQPGRLPEAIVERAVDGGVVKPAGDPAVGDGLAHGDRGEPQDDQCAEERDGGDRIPHRGPTRSRSRRGSAPRPGRPRRPRSPAGRSRRAGRGRIRLR